MQRIRMPHSIASRLVSGGNAVAYALNSFRHSRQAHVRPSIGFRCGFQGLSGGATATATIAGLLSRDFNVYFESNPRSHYNRMVDPAVKLVSQLPSHCSLIVCDASCDHEFMTRVRNDDIPLVVCSHGLPDRLHKLDPGFIRRSLDIADRVVFVSAVQQEAFQLVDDHYRIIPYAAPVVQKTRHGRNTGCVGNLAEERKHAESSVRITKQSSADAIHLWGAQSDVWTDPRVIVHPWQNDKRVIYDSFDCLVFMSELETFGLVVIEAMSAGIPALLNDIEVFRQFESCPGVELVDRREECKAAELVDRMLESKLELRPYIMAHFEKTYSRAAVTDRWVNVVKELIG